jgi:hypothetical protein
VRSVVATGRLTKEPRGSPADSLSVIDVRSKAPPFTKEPLHKPGAMIVL